MRRRLRPVAPFARILVLMAAACCLAQVQDDQESGNNEVERPESNSTIETVFPTFAPETPIPTYPPTVGETTQPSVPPSEAPLYLVRDFLLEKKDIIG